MTLKNFIRMYKKEIDEVIRKVCPNCKYFNYEERRLWVLNDEGLYRLARSEGVNI